MKTAFLFGAGASYGLNNVWPKSPPLGKDLFPDLQKTFPYTWGQLPSDVSETFIGNFETGMGKIIEKYSVNIPLLMKDMAVYFSNFRVVGDNEHTKILEKLKEEKLLSKTSFATLNYDLLFELSANRVGLSVNYFSNLGSDEGVNLLKLHGSCNFKLNSIEATGGVQFTTGVVFDGGLNVLQPVEVPQVFNPNNALYPAMALYAYGKPTPIAPTPIKRLQQSWEEIALKVDRLVLIGTWPNPDDNHIWNPISKSNGELFFIGDRDDFEKWTEKYRVGKKNNWLGSYFTETLPKMLEKS